MGEGELAGARLKRALVVGSSSNVWEDVAAAMELGAPYDAVYCTNTTGALWDRGPFTWVTLHPEHMQTYAALRANNGLPENLNIVGPLIDECGRHQQEMRRRMSYVWNPKVTRNSGSSGLFAVKIALDEGHRRVVLAGVPMTVEAGHITRGKQWDQCKIFAEAWKLTLPQLLGKVKSMSGWTKEILGSPTKEWLETGD